MDIILSNKTLESQKSENYENKHEDYEYEDKDEDYENKNEYEYENKNEDYENKNEYEYENKTEDENKNKDDDDKTIDQNKVKGLNDILDEIIDKSKLFEEQIKSLKKREDLEIYFLHKDYDDKKLKYKYFKLTLADMSNEIDEKLFEKIFGHTLIKLADKLINTTNKEENQIIVKNIEKNKDKLFEMDEFNDWVIQPSNWRITLKESIDIILDFNEELN